MTTIDSPAKSSESLLKPAVSDRYDRPGSSVTIEGPEDETPVWSWRPRDPRLARGGIPQPQVWVESVDRVG